MKLSKKVIMYRRIEEHGNNLLTIYPQATETDPVKLCKKLRHLETRGNALAVHYCNGTGGVNSANWGDLSGAIVAKAVKILGPGPAIFGNGDARGYFLKIEDEQARGLKIHKDWGGYGIIAPEFDGGA